MMTSAERQLDQKNVFVLSPLKYVHNQKQRKILFHTFLINLKLKTKKHCAYIKRCSKYSLKPGLYRFRFSIYHQI